MYKNEKDLIDGELPYKLRSDIVSSIFMGYELVIQLVKENMWLKSDYGKNTYGYLRNAAVSFCMDQKITAHSNLITSKPASNSRNNYNYIQLMTERSLINISQVQSPNSVPPYSDFRYENSFKNRQIELFINSSNSMEVDKKEIVETHRYYMILTHGCDLSLPSFIRIGIPEVGATRWKYQYNLLRDPNVISRNDEEEVKSILPKFKEQLKKGVQGDGQKF